MSNFCGWTRNAAEPRAPERVLDAMISRLPHHNHESSVICRKGSFASVSRGGGTPADLYAADGLQVACYGALRWEDDALQDSARSRGVAHTIASLYRQLGSDLPAHLHGSFSIVIHDAEKRQTVLAVDRAGICTLAFHAADNQLVFSTRADSVASHPDIGFNIRPQGVYDYLFFHMIPSPGSIFKGVEKLRPGERAIFRDGRIQRGFYWQAAYAERQTASRQELEAEFHQVLHQSVAHSLNGSRPGAFLSGGTDSSTVSGVLTEVLGEPAETCSIGFDAEGFDETEYAQIASRHFGTKHHQYYVTPQDVVDAIPKIAAAYDEPFGNASAIPTYYCAKLAREHGIETLLAGDGGDELFGGNSRYATQKIFELYSTIPGPLRSHLIEPFVFGIPGGTRIPPVRKLQSYIRQARIPLPDRLETYNFLQRTDPAEIFETGFLEAVNPEAPLELIREVYHRTASASAVNRMMHTDLKNTLADNDLRKVSRMCELAGIEVRYPLVDEDMIEFSGRIPPDLKLKGMKLRYFFKEALKDFLPREILTKSKHGFGLPFGLWMNEYKPLQELAMDSLASLQQRDYVQKGYIQFLRSQHDSEHASYYGVMIWVLMMLELWLQSYVASAHNAASWPGSSAVA